MRIIIEPDYEAVSRKAAQIVAKRIREKPDIVLSLATGETPLGMYRELIRMHREENLDFSRATTFNLDEYWRIPSSHPQSYHYFMWKNFFSQININPDNVHIPSGTVDDIDTYCLCYEKEIK
ncbi:6-phosphogluconolactonase, partial [Candidatus Aerophobetes bacterium]|nr:6-phosphogluconolactonase [Candidatus Aerophobetes bacterium]